MSKLHTVFVIASTLLYGGCHHGFLPKRQSELNCPTDIRQTIPWCAGEDAIFQCPCGPSPHFYGHKPTCWGHWPASGSEWRDSYCGYPVIYSQQPEMIIPQPAAEPLPELEVQPPQSRSFPTPPMHPGADEFPPIFAPPTQAQLQLPRVTQKTRAGKGAPSQQKSRRVESAEVTDHPQLKSPQVRQVSYIEETTLESHAWTGPQFIR